ncbi:MAG: hypothetical protein AAF570_16780 [Bacteroidota bacterium]
MMDKATLGAFLDAFRTLRNEISDAYSNGDYQKADQLVDQGLETYPHAPILFVLKGILCQLLEGGSDLETPRQWFEAAKAFGCGEHDPTHELARYDFVIRDDHRAALMGFRAVEETAEELLLQAMRGQLSVLRALNRASEAADLVTEIRSRFPDRADLELESE